MSLPLSDLTFYRMADQSPAAATIAGLLNAIYAALSATTDYRGTSLASTHLWTVAREQPAGTTEAVYATAPSGTGMGKSPGLIWAGDSGAPTPAMLTPDSFTASHLLIGVAHTIGAYNAWDNAAPFTSGTFSGFWRAAGITWNATTAKVRAFISQEAIFIQLIGATVTQQAWMLSGAIVEPLMTNGASGGLDAETDDRLYGMMCTGSGGVMTAAWLNAASVQTPFMHGTGSGNTHMMVFQPGTSNVYVCGRKSRFVSPGSTAEVTTMGGKYAGDLMAICRCTASGTPDGYRLGNVRSIAAIGSVQSGKKLWDNVSVDYYHFVSPDTGAVADGVMLKAAA